MNAFRRVGLQRCNKTLDYGVAHAVDVAVLLYGIQLIIFQIY